MHDYAYSSDERRKWTVWLYRVSLALGLLLGFLLAALGAVLDQLALAIVVQPPATMVLFRTVHNLFETRLWRNTWLRKFGLVNMPNLNGRWQGYVESSFDNKLASKPDSLITRDVTVDIVQTWNQIRISWQANESTSSSNVAAIELLDSCNSELHYLYYNRTRIFSHPNMHAHSGATRLQIGENELTGEYFTDRDPATKGDIHLERVA